MSGGIVAPATGNGGRTRGGIVATYLRTDGHDGQVRRGRAALANQYGQEAAEAVRAYREVRDAAGLTTEARAIGQLARCYMLARAKGWSRELCLEAVRTIGPSKRSPAYFHREWLPTIFNSQGLAEHEAAKAEAASGDVMAPDVMAAIFGGAR